MLTDSSGRRLLHAAAAVGLGSQTVPSGIKRVMVRSLEQPPASKVAGCQMQEA